MSLSITQFPEEKGHLVSGDLKSLLMIFQPLWLWIAFSEIFDALSECQWIEELDGIVVIPKWDLKIGQTILKLEKFSKEESWRKL